MADLTKEVRQLTGYNTPFVRRDLHDEQIGSIRHDIAEIRVLARWAVGLIASSIIGAVVVLVIVAGRGG